MSGLGSKRRCQRAAQIAIVLGVWLLGGWMFYGNPLSLGAGGGFMPALKPQPQSGPTMLAAGQHLDWAADALPQTASGVLNAAGDRWQQLLQVWLPPKIPTVSKSTKRGKKSDRLMLADLARPVVLPAAKFPKSSNLNLPTPFSAAPPDEPQGRSPDSGSEVPQAPEPPPKHQIAVLKGHQRAVWSVAFSPDGQQIATAGSDGTARLWNLGGDELAQLVGHERAVWSVAFSPDGQQIATAGADGTARLWNLDGDELATFSGGDRAMWDVAFSPSRQQIATASTDGTARLWNLDGRELAVFRGHERAVWSVAFSPNGQRLATTSADGTARLWNLSGRQLAVLRGHDRAVWSVAFSPDGQRLATTGADGTARLWNLLGQPLATFSGHSRAVWDVAFSPDGQRLATASTDGTARLWNLDGSLIETFELETLEGHRRALWSVAFSPDGQRLATAGADGTARIWELPNFTTPDAPQVVTLSAIAPSSVENFQIAPNSPEK